MLCPPMESIVSQLTIDAVTLDLQFEHPASCFQLPTICNLLGFASFHS